MTLDRAMFIVGQDVSMPDREQANLWPVSFASGQRRELPAARQRREKSAEAEFPNSKQMIELAHPHGRNVGLEGIADYLLERGVPG
jgi:hypothetical protein